MTREQRIHDAINEFGTVTEDGLNFAEPGQWLLVQTNDFGHRFLADFKTVEEANVYATEELGGEAVWFPTTLIDLDTGERHEPTVVAAFATAGREHG